LRKYRLIILSLMLLLTVLVLGGCGSQVVATVNGEKITSQELDNEVTTAKNNLAQQGYNLQGEQAKEFEEKLRQEVLQQLIDRRLLTAEINRLSLAPTDKEVQDAIAGIKQQLGTEAEFKKYLAANGINEPKLEDFVKEQLSYSKLAEKISSEVPPPTDTEIKDYFAKNSNQYSEPEQRQVSHVLIGVGEYSNGKNRSDIDAKMLALQVVNKVAAGSDFGKLAKQYSDDLGSKDNGGQYPAFSKGSGFVEEFENAAFTLKAGQYTVEPVKTTYGYHVIRLDKIIPAKTHTLDEVKEQIIASLRDEEVQQKQNEYILELRNKAKVINNLAKETATQDNEKQATKE